MKTRYYYTIGGNWYGPFNDFIDAEADANRRVERMMFVAEINRKIYDKETDTWLVVHRVRKRNISPPFIWSELWPDSDFVVLVSGPLGLRLDA